MTGGTQEASTTRSRSLSDRAATARAVPAWTASASAQERRVETDGGDLVRGVAVTDIRRVGGQTGNARTTPERPRPAPRRPRQRRGRPGRGEGARRASGQDRRRAGDVVPGRRPTARRAGRRRPRGSGRTHGSAGQTRARWPPAHRPGCTAGSPTSGTDLAARSCRCGTNRFRVRGTHLPLGREGPVHQVGADLLGDTGAASLGGVPPAGVGGQAAALEVAHTGAGLAYSVTASK